MRRRAADPARACSPARRRARLALASRVVALAMLVALAEVPFGRPALAQLPGAGPELLPPDRAFRLSARALDRDTVEVRFDIADGYYLYRDRMSFRVEPVAAADALLPPGKRKHDVFFGDVDTYRGSVDLRVPLEHEAAPGEMLTVYAESQGCADAGVCYPPNPQQVRITVPAAGARAGDFVQARSKRLFN